MNKKTLLLVATTFAFSSCVDDNYKLSDLDTTVGVNVTKLTVPLNVDSLVLDQMIDLELLLSGKTQNRIKSCPNSFIIKGSDFFMIKASPPNEKAQVLGVLFEHLLQ